MPERVVFLANINQITIRHFKSIDNLTLDLGNLNVLIGTNGSGKSNILEAIGILSAAIKGEVQYSDLINRGIRLSTPEVMRSSFKNEKRPPSINLIAKGDKFSYEATIHTMPNREYIIEYSTESLRNSTNLIAGISNRSKNRQMTLRTKQQKKLSIFPVQTERTSSIVPVALQLGDFGKDEAAVISALDALKKYAIYAPSTPVLRDFVLDTSSRQNLGIFGGGIAATLNKIFAKDKAEQKLLFDNIFRFIKGFSWLTTIGTATPRKELRSQFAGNSNVVAYFRDAFMKVNFNDLYAYDVSEGALYVLFVALLLVFPESPNIFALDNVDSTLNPGMVKITVKNIADYLKDNSHKQILLTTHNPTTLDAIDLFDPSHRLFVVERDLCGHTIARRIEIPEGVTRDQWQDEFKNMKLSDIWLSGALGALPSEDI